MQTDLFLLFVVTTAIIVIVPGPAAITVAALAAGNGVKRAQFGISGVAAANAFFFALSATGMAALIIASHTLFAVIKWAGVAYLAYLGISAIFGRAGGINVEAAAKASTTSLFRRGFVVELANPKALLYFAAILPQFLDSTQPIAPQLLTMGAATMALDFTIYTVYAFIGHSLVRGGVKTWLISSFNKGAGGMLLFTSAKMATVSAH